jgi:hypothetical protein
MGASLTLRCRVGCMKGGAFALLGIVGTLSLGLMIGVGCVRSPNLGPPVASLAASTGPAVELNAFREAWALRALDARRLEAFLLRYPNEPSVALVRVYLVFIQIEQKQLDAAEALLRTLDDIPPGATRDLMTVARARCLRRRGLPGAALALLRPLVGKVIDKTDREVFFEEISRSAMASRDDFEVLAYLDAWLRGVPEESKERVRVEVQSIVDALPRAVLEPTYRAMRSTGAASGYGVETQRFVADRLVGIAVEENDVALARWLVEQSGANASWTGSAEGDELGELASSRRGLASVAGRTVGLLLPSRDLDLRDEAADVVRGIAWALDLPRARGRQGGVRLVTREDGTHESETRAAMEELAGEGASILVVGFDRESADRALRWSEQNGVATMLLAAPSPSKTQRRSTVVLGERVERQLRSLSDALLRHGVRTAAYVSDGPDDIVAERTGDEDAAGLTILPRAPCTVAGTSRPRFPIEGWLRAGATGWLISGSSSCARDVVEALGASLSKTTMSGAEVALTLESGIPVQGAPKWGRWFSVAAGILPVFSSKPEDAPNESVRHFMERLGARPSYWTALGHDAGALAKAALGELPLDTTTDRADVEHRRAIAQSKIMSAKASLWTTEEEGIGENRFLGRTLRVVSWGRTRR